MKIGFKAMRDYDLQNDECFCRSLEMTVDHLTNHDGYSVQFWKDCKLYDLDQAVSYLQRHLEGKMQDASEWAVIEKEWAELENEIKEIQYKIKTNPPKKEVGDRVQDLLDKIL